MNEIRSKIKLAVKEWLELNAPAHADAIYALLILAWIAIVSIAIHLILHRVVQKLLNRSALAGRAGWHSLLFTHKLFRNVALIVQGGIIYIQADLWLSPSSMLRSAIETSVEMWMLVFALLALFSILDALQDALVNRASFTRFPIRGLLQSIKLVATVLIGLVVVSLLMGKSPVILLSGLGALSAVMMLVFKDPILGLVAGIQLSANNMLAIGDWLEMPKYGADGDVIDIGLTTVKVQNWDKTITTIPTYALITDSFKNWRGMSESGGRRIKRSVLIDTGSVKFLDEDDLRRLRKTQLLSEYLQRAIDEVEKHNTEVRADLSSFINGRRLTNLGTLRAYLVSYLKANPAIHQGMTLMVRQLEVTPQGLPLEIYAFTNTTKWAEYENIQADIFDHLFAVLPEFGLHAHEAPTGRDIRALAAGRTMNAAGVGEN